MRLKKLGLVVFLGVCCLYSCKNLQTERGSKKGKWVKIFNGKNLDDWTIKIKGHPVGENYKNTFVVEDGVMKVNYDEYNGTFNASYGHIFYNKEYSNYKMRMQYRFTGDQIKDGAGWATRNSGVMIHCESPENMGLDQSFPVSIEVQLLGGLGSGNRPTANVCTPGTHIVLKEDKVTGHCFNSTSKTFHGDQWVELEIEVRNDSIIKHKINGENVFTYFKPQIGGGVDANKAYWKAKDGNPLKKGFISLQSESHPCEFKNIEILEL